MSGGPAAGTPDFGAPSVGQARAEGSWLDVHFDGCEPEYRAMLAEAGIRPGDRVLDLGCGNGRFLELIRVIAGTSGSAIGADLSVTMLQLARENGRAERAALVAVEATRLPFRDRSFNVAWCANIFEYLDADGQVACLSELRRVLRPGGTITVKDSEWAHKIFHPVPLDFWYRYLHVMATRGMPDAFVGRGIAGSFKRAGLVPLVRTVLTERTSPLTDAEQRWIAMSASAVAGDARGWMEPEAAAEIDEFARRFTPGAGGCALDGPDLYYCEGNVLVSAHTPV